MDFPFSFNQKSSLLLIFFFQGIVFSIILLRNGIVNQHISSKWLSFLLFLLSLYIAPYMLGYAGWYGMQPYRGILFFIPFMQVLLIGPVVFFYIRSLLYANFKYQKKDWLHFIPAILYMLYSIVVFVTDYFILDDYYFYADGRDKDLKTWYQLTGLISMIAYLGYSLKNYLNYKKAIFNTVSFADSILFKWIQNFLFAFLTLLILRILFFILNPQWEEFGSQFWYYISFSFVLAYIAINGYAQAVKTTSFFTDEINEETIEEQEEKEVSNAIDVDSWKEKLEHLLTVEKAYTNPKLSLANIAKALETNTKTVSTTINIGYQKNFNDFVNDYRIQAVKRKIDANEHEKSTLLGLALDCGFNSKATFNRAFKKNTSLTPKQYILSIK